MVNALVGGTLGQERTVLPLLASRAFQLAEFTAALTFILAFGAVKAITNPTLLAAIGDVAHPAWRARSVGVYRLWRAHRGLGPGGRRPHVRNPARSGAASAPC